MKKIDDFCEVISNLRHRKASQTLTLCPRCGSPKITLSNSLDLFLTPRNYLCQECGYIGPILLELEKEQKQEK